MPPRSLALVRFEQPGLDEGTLLTALDHGLLVYRAGTHVETRRAVDCPGTYPR